MRTPNGLSEPGSAIQAGGALGLSTQYQRGWLRFSGCDRELRRNHQASNRRPHRNGQVGLVPGPCGWELVVAGQG